MKICLGTVKLGVPEYGFSSSAPDPAFDPIAFLGQAESLGIRRFDTSPRYGNSEAILGKYLRHSKSCLSVSSKIDNLKPGNPDTPCRMRVNVEASLEKLHLDTLDICYLHQNELEIISDPYVHEGLMQLKEKHLIQNTGVSLYSFEECDYALQSGLFDAIQIPVNICDISFYNRFIKQASPKTKFIVRSLLLQGTLINRRKISSRIKQSDEIVDYLEQLDRLASEQGFTLLQLALAFGFGLENIDHYLIGTTNISNLKKNIRCADIQLGRELFDKLAVLASPDKTWTNPRNW